MSNREEPRGQTQDTLEGLYLLTGLGMPWDELEEVAREKDVWVSLHCCHNDLIRDKGWKIDGWMDGWILAWTGLACQKVLKPPLKSAKKPTSPG